MVMVKELLLGILKVPRSISRLQGTRTGDQNPGCLQGPHFQAQGCLQRWKVIATKGHLKTADASVPMLLPAEHPGPPTWLALCAGLCRAPGDIPLLCSSTSLQVPHAGVGARNPAL